MSTNFISNETVAILCATILGCFACFFPDKAMVALPVATGLIGYLTGKDSGKNDPTLSK